MPRFYVVTFDATSISAAQDVFEFSPASNKPIRLRALRLFQYGTADFGDAQAEGIGLRIIRNITAAGSAGSSATPAPIVPGDPAASFTARLNDTTVAAASAPIVLWEDGFNVQAGYQENWPEAGMAPECSSTQVGMVVRLTAPADALTTMNGTALIEELG